jgi:cytochrome c6
MLLAAAPCTRGVHAPPSQHGPAASRRCSTRPHATRTSASAAPSRSSNAALAAAAALLSTSLLGLSPTVCRADEGAAPALPVALNAPELFARTCAGCHAGGGNVVDMAHSLRAPDLARDGLEDTSALYDVIYRGRVRAARPRCCMCVARCA